jgi:hypothetical protein
MGFPVQSADAPMMSDAFMAFRLMMSHLDEISNAYDLTNGRIRTTDIIESGTITTVGTVTTVTTVTTVATVTNLGQIGGVAANSFIFDEMDIVWNTGIRPQIV